MNEQTVRNLIGEADFTELLIKLPDQFYLDMSPAAQEALWKAILAEAIHGMLEIDRLVEFVRNWLQIYTQIVSIVQGVKGHQI